jgi:hypothetical protein
MEEIYQLVWNQTNIKQYFSLNDYLILKITIDDQILQVKQ